jgi:hypothetical protein
MRYGIFRIGIFGFGGVFSLCALVLVPSACESLKDVSLVPDGSIDDLDAGDIPEPPEDSGDNVTPPGNDAAPPASGRVRLANMTVDAPGPVDLCVKAGTPANAPWEGPRIAGLSPGQVSAHFFLAVPGQTAQYLYRVVRSGAACDGDPGAVVFNFTAQSLRQAGGTTLAVVGNASGADAGDANPRGVALTDNVSPPANATQFRAIHGIPDMPAFDVVINGETVVSGIRFGSAIGFPYANSDTSGFKSIPAGIPEGSTLTLRAGTTVASFTVPQRQRRGIAVTLFTTGRIASQVVASLCSDRSPPAGESLATCLNLPRAK